MWKDRTLVCYGAYQYFDSQIDRLLEDYEVDYIFPGDFPTSKDLRGIPKIRKEGLSKLTNPLVIICFAKSSDIADAAKFCRKENIAYTSIDILKSRKINVDFVKKTGGEYTDINNNFIKVHANAAEKIVIDVANSKNARVNIGAVSVREKLHICLAGEGGRFEIGDNTSVFQMNVNVNRDGNVSIGADCMISHHVDIAQSDQHLIFDIETGKRINYPKNVIVGNHVWLGRECQLLGGANIGNGSICGSRCVTSGKFPDNCIIAGVPGKVIRENIMWSRDLIEKENIDVFSQCKDQSALKYLP